MSSSSGAQKRVGIANQSITINEVNGDGGGGPTVVASLNIGPDFGDQSGNDDTTFISQTEEPELAAVDFGGDLEDASVIDLDAVDFLGNLTNSGSIDLYSADFAGDLASTSQIDLFNLTLDFDLLGSSAAVTLPSVDFEGNLLPEGAVDLEDVSLDGSLESTSSFYQSDSTKSSFVNINDILYVSVGMNTRQDASGTQVISFYDSSTFVGTNPFLIRPVTVAGVTNDERVAYFKFDTSGIDGDFEGYELEFRFRATNPSLVSNALITIEIRSTPSDPWGSAPYSWDQYEPVNTGTLERTETSSLGANSTEIISATVPALFGSSAQGDWTYIRITSDLIGSLIEIDTSDLDGDPSTVPHEAPSAYLEIEFAP